MLIGVNHTCIYIVFSRYLCNLNVRFTPIFLKITLIPHFLMFCRIKRKIKHRKGKKLRRKNLLFEALVRISEDVRQSEAQERKRRSLKFTLSRYANYRTSFCGVDTKDSTKSLATKPKTC